MKIYRTEKVIAAFSQKTDGDLSFLNLNKDQLESLRKSLSVKLSKDIQLPLCLNQVHKADIVQITDSKNFPNLKLEADALITDLSNTPIAVFTADCCPILISGKKAISATHAGWKSTLQNISAKTAEKHRELFGTAAKDLTAWIGPCIGVCCFEVGDEVYEAFLSKNYEYNSFFIKGNKWHLNLRAINRYQLESAGIPKNQIIDYDDCTYCQPDKYFSYRYQKQRNGSMLSIIIKG